MITIVFITIKTGFDFWNIGIFSKKSANLALQRGVKASCDSMETAELSAEKAIDGDDETLSSRWSSENNWENASHYIELEFPEEISVSFVVLKWERTNVTEYRLEGSTDGTDWQTYAAFDGAPASRKQEIPLQEAVTVRFLRLSTSAVSQEEADYSNLYQNVSLYEFEVYADKPAAYLLEEPSIVMENNARYLQMPEAPEGYRITYLGADYEQVIGADRMIYETIQEKEVTVGFLVEEAEGENADGAVKQADGENAGREVSFTIQVPAAAGGPEGGNKAPEVIPAVAEWDGGEGSFVPGEDSRIVVQKDAPGEAVSGEDALRRTAELFAERYREIMGREIPVIEGAWEDVRRGDFYLVYGDEAARGGAKNDRASWISGGALGGLGEEGYLCEITDRCVISGTHQQGVYWGTITVLQILKGQGGRMPQGRIRDYPEYPVRGFGIDVARKPVSMAMLYQIVENMSWYKMNDLCIHLNDNVILSTSGLTGSAEEAMTAYSAFRLDSGIMNEKGERLASADYAYTAEEFAALIADAGNYGVRIVPEIDTPAHSLSITKLFPEYALTVRNEAVDQIDLNREEAVALVKDIWREALCGGQGTNGKQGVSAGAAFQGASVVNIGMDEYYGDGETCRQYMNELIRFIRSESSVGTIRLWGSLSNIDGTTMPPAERLQMNIWSTLWADPLSMYRDGYTLINMQNNHLYIIPGGGYDYLDAEELYRNWEPNKFYDYNQLETIPAYSPQMAGAAYMIWNDMSGGLDVGIGESDLFDRFFAPLGVLGGKLWGETEGSYQEWQARFWELGLSPGSDPYAAPAWEGEALRLLEEEALSLSGGSDYWETGYTGGYGNGIGIGGSYTVSMKVYRERSGDAENSGASSGENPPDAQEEILFETDSAYGQTAFKAAQKGTGQVGFSREGRDYSFACTLPEGEWVTLTVRCERARTSLYVNGELADTLGDGQPFGEYASFLFPLERIGSKTESFHGMIKEIEVKADGSVY
ncbi:MAG: family 20 glycosylhydrolase [Blautia sp.]|nr:family 20 glycosylhydrolase [Blautia sp.]MCM1199669.1 family 20 glycosylhydrolase [Bacteroides fragilis]